MTSIHQFIEDLALDKGDRPAVTDESGTISWRELNQRTNQVARIYENRGVHAGDLVSIVLPNSIAFYIATIASWKLGATPHPVSVRLPPSEFDAILELANPKLVVGLDQKPMDFPFLAIEDAKISDASSEGLPIVTSENWKAINSGGTTGRPKIIYSQDAGDFDLEFFKMLHIEPNRTHLVCGPMYHNGPFIFSFFALFTGNHNVVMPRFDAEKTLVNIEKYKIDMTMMVPTMMRRILLLDEEVRNKYDTSSLRILLHLGAPCPPWLKREWISWLGPDRIHELYGGTEGIGTTWIVGDEWLEKEGSVGKIIGESQIKVVGESGEDLPAGEVGEIYFLPENGPGSTYRYLGAKSKRRAEWESLGDIGYIDEDGYVFLCDRKSDMIISGGVNIYPAEVEAVIDSHPQVRSSAVLGVPDDDLGEMVCAVIDSIADVSQVEILKFLENRLSRPKIPRQFRFVSSPLRDDAGKVRRRKWRERFI